MERVCSFPNIMKVFRLLDTKAEDSLASAVGQCIMCQDSAVDVDVPTTFW